ncbi:MAG: hypothetical protein U0183_35345 [Polyangiaceae bacterium]
MRSFALGLVLSSATLAFACGSEVPPPGGTPPSLDASAVDSGNADAVVPDDARSEDGGVADAAPLPPCPAVDEGLVSLEDAPLGLRVAGDAVYWVSSRPDGAGFVREVRRSVRRQAPETLASTGRDVGAVAVAAERVLFAEPASGAEPARLRGVEGGQVRTVATLDASLGEIDPFAIEADTKFAYLLARGAGGTFRYSVLAVDLATGSVDRVGGYTLPVGTTARAMVADGPDLVFGYTSGFVFRTAASARGTALRPLVDEAMGVDAFSVGTAGLYYASEGAVRLAPRAGGTPISVTLPVRAYRTVLAHGGALIVGARDGSGVESIHELRTDGTSCLLASTGVVSVFSMGTDGTYVYFTNTATRAAGGAVRFARLAQ